MIRRKRSLLLALLLAPILSLGAGCPPKGPGGIDIESLSPCQRDILERTRVNSDEELLFILEGTRCS